jgi:hypothetical protein
VTVLNGICSIVEAAACDALVVLCQAERPVVLTSCTSDVNKSIPAAKYRGWTVLIFHIPFDFNRGGQTKASKIFFVASVNQGIESDTAQLKIDLPSFLIMMSMVLLNERIGCKLLS